MANLPTADSIAVNSNAEDLTIEDLQSEEVVENDVVDAAKDEPSAASLAANSKNHTEPPAVARRSLRLERTLHPPASNGQRNNEKEQRHQRETRVQLLGHPNASCMPYRYIVYVSPACILVFVVVLVVGTIVGEFFQ